MSRPPARTAVRTLARVMMRLLTRTTVSGLDRLPAGGPLLLVFNHLGHFDSVLIIAKLPYNLDCIALSDLFDVPVTGPMLRLYGAIPVHRDVFDRTVIEQALNVLNEKGFLILAPEARQSLTGALEQARGGAAYLALKANVPILPIALTGTENVNVYGLWKRLRRPVLTLTVGEAFHLPDLPLTGAQRKQSLAQASLMIMTRIAALLPPKYRGVYADAV